MADSTVQYSNIDETFPVAGQDNDSQGFRDNFSEIKSALQNANIELTNYLTNGARKDEDNDFNSNTLENGALIQMAKVMYNTGNVDSASAEKTIRWTNGHVQNVTVTDDVTLTLAGWPANNRYAEMRLILRGDGTARTITWEPDSAGTIRVDSNWPAGAFTVTSATTPTIVDVWSSDGGLTVYMRYLGEFAALS